MVLTILLGSDMGRIARLVASHPEWDYATQRGERGTIVIIVNPPVAPEGMQLAA